MNTGSEGGRGSVKRIARLFPDARSEPKHRRRHGSSTCHTPTGKMAMLYCVRISIGGNRATFVAWLLPEPVVQSVRAATSTVDGAGELAPSFFLLPLRAPHRHEPIQTEKPHADRKCLRIPARVAIGPTVLIETSSSSGGWPPQALVEPGRADRGDRGARGVGMGDVEEKAAALRDDDRGDAQERRSMGGEPGVAKSDRIGGKSVDALGRPDLGAKLPVASISGSMGGPDVQRKCCNCVTAAAWGPQERNAPPDVAFGRERIGRIKSPERISIFHGKTQRIRARCRTE